MLLAVVTVISCLFTTAWANCNQQIPFKTTFSVGEFNGDWFLDSIFAPRKSGLVDYFKTNRACDRLRFQDQPGCKVQVDHTFVDPNYGVHRYTVNMVLPQASRGHMVNSPQGDGSQVTLNVIDVDYEKSALLHSCEPVNNVYFDSVYILTRHLPLTATARGAYINQLKKLGLDVTQDAVWDSKTFNAYSCQPIIGQNMNVAG